MNFIKYNIISLTCVIIAGILAFQSMTGWGWFLCIAFMLYQSSKSSKSDDDDDDDDD